MFGALEPQLEYAVGDRHCDIYLLLNPSMLTCCSELCGCWDMQWTGDVRAWHSYIFPLLGPHGGAVFVDSSSLWQ